MAARRVFGHQERALQVRVHHGVPVGLGDAEQQVVLGEPGVVDQDIDLAEVLVTASASFST